MGKWQFPPKGGHMDLPTRIYLQTMTGKEVDERLKKNDLIILPIGSTENHGPHACSGEDTYLVTRMAEQVAGKNRLHSRPTALVRFASISSSRNARNNCNTRRNLD